MQKKLDKRLMTKSLMSLQISLFDFDNTGNAQDVNTNNKTIKYHKSVKHSIPCIIFLAEDIERTEITVTELQGLYCDSVFHHSSQLFSWLRHGHLQHMRYVIKGSQTLFQ